MEMKENMLNCFDKELFKEFICFLGHYDSRRTRRKGDKMSDYLPISMYKKKLFDIEKIKCKLY